MNIIWKPLLTNFEKGRGGKAPQMIVIHIIGLPGITAESAFQHFSNSASEVSAHYIVKRNGEVWNLISDTDTAWANGAIAYDKGLPLLPTNQFARESWQKRIRLNQISLSIENEGSENEDITEAQYFSNSMLVRQLCAKWKIPIHSSYICGHREIKRSKVCPGRLSVGKIISLAQETSQIQPIMPTYTPQIRPKTNIPEWLKNLIYRTQNKLGNIIWGDRMLGGTRDLNWHKESKAYLKTHNVSELSGKKGTLLNPLVIHHIIPVSRDKSKEMDKSNWIVLTTWEHLVFAHLGSWLSYNPTLREDVEVWKKKYAERP